ncbi:MAG: hypothetical protein WAO28_00560 [Candidatus Microsaccharimonas sp.]
MAGEWIEPNFAGPTPFLPPEEARVYDPRKEGRKPTPVNTVTKLVDRPALMIMTRDSVVPGYDWQAPEVRKKRSNHHLHWPHPRDSHGFRNRGSLRTNIRPIAHNWIHEFTIPPAAVGEETEHAFGEAEDFALEMRTIANHPLFLGRETLRINAELTALYGELPFLATKAEIREDKKLDLEFAFDSFSTVFERARRGPAEFQVIDYGSKPLRNVQDMMAIAHEISRTLRRQAELDQMILDRAVDIAA